MRWFKSKKFLYAVCSFAASIALFFSVHGERHCAHAFTNQVIQHGAVGDDVIELQSRLQYIGFYNGPIDGVFGWSTYWAVRNFQYEFGMDIDGLVGAEMKRKLVAKTKYNEGFVKRQINKGNKFTHYGGTPLNQQAKESKKQGTAQQPARGGAPAAPAKKPTARGNNRAARIPQKPTSVNVPNGFSQNDLKIMANAVHGESRGEPYIGQVAVAAVIINRINSPSFPNTAAGVIFEPGAFTAVADGQIWLTPNETSKKAVLDALNGWDPTGNALYYFNPNTATSAWIWSRPQIKQIGKHIFCK
ncbi:spore cortex-lytic enzyme [Bacillus songklensis]|uniref:Spore cortex-lytic enzyme n=1 Tax=Bacillus songklensis TaxID=1069116 RepID=A0ABV8AYJ2_9BACI